MPVLRSSTTHGKKQVWENNPFRGYLSTLEDFAHFGLGKTANIDSVIISWHNGPKQILKNIPANQTITVEMNTDTDYKETPAENTDPLFSEITESSNISFTHTETDFVDFNIQKLIPHKFSEYGPALAAGDIDGNGLDDIVAGGSSAYSAQIFLQQADGKFIQKPLISEEKAAGKLNDDTGILLFDADSDGDLDMYIASGGYENESNSSAYQDHFYKNDGKGNFTEDTAAIPRNFTSKFCVRAADFDKDGDLDLFVAGRVDPWKYPKPVSSFILQQ